MKAILPCPFCGDQAVLRMLKNRQYPTIYCQNLACPASKCAAMGNPESVDDAIDKWNTRRKVSAISKILKICWSDGRNNWHHNFIITSPATGGETLVVHVTADSVAELLDADRV